VFVLPDLNLDSLFSLVDHPFCREFWRLRGFVDEGKSEYHQLDPSLEGLLLSPITIVLNRFR